MFAGGRAEGILLFLLFLHRFQYLRHPVTDAFHTGTHHETKHNHLGRFFLALHARMHGCTPSSDTYYPLLTISTVRSLRYANNLHPQSDSYIPYFILYDHASLMALHRSKQTALHVALLQISSKAISFTRRTGLEEWYGLDGGFLSCVYYLSYCRIYLYFVTLGLHPEDIVGLFTVDNFT